MHQGEAAQLLHLLPAVEALPQAGRHLRQGLPGNNQMYLESHFYTRSYHYVLSQQTGLDLKGQAEAGTRWRISLEGRNLERNPAQRGGPFSSGSTGLYPDTWVSVFIFEADTANAWTTSYSNRYLYPIGRV